MGLCLCNLSMLLISFHSPFFILLFSCAVQFVNTRAWKVGQDTHGGLFCNQKTNALSLIAIQLAFLDSGSISFFFSLYTSSFYRKAVSVLVSFSQFDRSIGQGVTIEFLFAPSIFLHLTKIICTSYCNAKLYFLASWTILSWIASYKMNANTSQSK